MTANAESHCFEYFGVNACPWLGTSWVQPSLTHRIRLGIPRRRQGPGNQSPPAGAPEHVPNLPGTLCWPVVSACRDTPGLQRSFLKHVQAMLAPGSLAFPLGCEKGGGCGCPRGGQRKGCLSGDHSSSSSERKLRPEPASVSLTMLRPAARHAFSGCICLVEGASIHCYDNIKHLACLLLCVSSLPWPGQPHSGLDAIIYSSFW